MPFSIYDKIPKSPLPSSPFDFIAKLAEGQKQDLDKLDARIAETQGLFAKLTPAEGHEPWAQKVSDRYNKDLNDLMDKYGGNPLSREFSRALTGLATTFAKDREVRDIIDSREFYEKNSGTIQQAIYNGAIVNAPGIMDQEHNYVPGNRTRYSWDAFKVTPFGDAGASIRTIFNILRDNKMKDENIKPIGVNPDGTNIYESTVTERIWNNEDTRKETALSILNTVFDPTRPDAGFNYLRANAEQLFLGDVEAQKAYVGEYIKNQGIPWNVNWISETKTLQNVKSGKGSGDGSDDVAKKVAVNTTVALDYMTDQQGNRITTADMLHNEATAYESTINSILTPETFNTISDDLLGPVDASGKRTIAPNAVVMDETTGYRLINTALIQDKIAKQRAEDYNMELMHAQNKQLAAKQTEIYFLEQAGFKAIYDNNGNIDITSQVPVSTLGKAEAIAFDKASRISINTEAGPQEMNFIPGIGEVNATEWNKKFNAPNLRMTREGLLEYLRGVQKSTSGQTIKLTDDAINKFMADFDKERTIALASLDKNYKRFNDSLTNYLNSTIYTNGYNYSITKDTDKRRIKDLLPLALEQRDIERANFGSKGGDYEQIVSEQDKEDIIKDVLEKTKDENYDYSNLSVRFDESKGKFVVDIATDDKGVLEIGSFDQSALAAIVQEQDPNLSTVYLNKKSSLIAQLESSNGRFAALNVPIQDATGKVIENNRVVVKSAFENHGTSITQGDYLFTLPEAPGSVLIAKNQWALINMTDAYTSLKQSGKTGTDLSDGIVKYMEAYGITSVSDRAYNVGGKYFPSQSTRVSPGPVGK